MQTEKKYVNVRTKRPNGFGGKPAVDNDFFCFERLLSSHIYPVSYYSFVALFKALVSTRLWRGDTNESSFFKQSK